VGRTRKRGKGVNKGWGWVGGTAEEVKRCPLLRGTTFGIWEGNKRRRRHGTPKRKLLKSCGPGTERRNGAANVRDDWEKAGREGVRG